MSTHLAQPGRLSCGFTLIEMLIVVAIIAILSAIALPSYQEHVAKGRRGEAMVALLEGAQALERYYSTNGSYLDDGTLAAVFPTQVPATGTAHYTIAAPAAATANSFTLRATATGAMTRDRCGNFELTQSGARQLDGNSAPVLECWRR